MRQPVTLHDLARHLRVHPTTISMALRGHHRISEGTRKRVKTLAERWRYTPNHVARSLRSRSTRTLGVAFPYASLPYYAMLLDALDAEADRRGLHLEVHFHQWSTRQEAAIVRTLLERRVDGLIAVPTELTPHANLAEHLSSHPSLPCVMIGNPGPDDPPAFLRGCVVTDMEKGSELLGRHLLAMGHRNICFVTTASPSPSGSTTNRIRGLRAAIHGDRNASLDIVMPGKDESADLLATKGSDVEYHFQQAQKIATRVFSAATVPTAMIAGNETLANVLIAFARRRGLRVPEDLSIACYDGTFLSTFGPISLTTVKQPVHEMARHALDLVLSTKPRNDRARPEVRIVEPELIQGESVANVAETSVYREK